jgi:chitin synthase
MNPYDPYDAQPNPYDSQYGDPFNPQPPQQYHPSPPPPPPPNLYQNQGGFAPLVVPTPPPLHPGSPPIITHTPPPPPPLGGHVQFGVPQQPTGYHRTTLYDGNDDDNPDDMDTGDIPLLRRDPSSSATLLPRPMPGGFDDGSRPGSVAPDDRSEVNIRYGRIPQRVPRRYKTVKKVE